jgi:hypothetical protein
MRPWVIALTSCLLLGAGASSQIALVLDPVGDCADDDECAPCGDDDCGACVCCHHARRLVAPLALTVSTIMPVLVPVERALGVSFSPRRPPPHEILTVPRRAPLVA